MADEQASFRQRAREWVRANLRPELAVQARAQQRSLFDAGLAGLSVPTEYGGCGYGPEYERTFAAEVARNGVPWRGVGTSLTMMLAHGSEHLKRRHIPAMLRGDEIWVQLLSESAAGSDLAGLGTVAEAAAGGYLVTGEKMWISNAESADYGSCLARTDSHAVKNRGLTMFAVPMRASGVTVRPIRTCTGSTDFCQVFFDHVRVESSDVIGEVGGGWTVATTGREQRNTSGAQGRSDVAAAMVHAVVQRAGGAAVDTRTADLVAQAWVRSVVQGHLEERVRASVARSALPRAATALVKLGRIWRDQANATAALDVLGLDGVCWPPATATGAASDYMEQRTRSVSGGTTEIQLNLVAERVLGLPREERTDLGRPFDELPANAVPPAGRAAVGIPDLQYTPPEPAS